MKTVSEPGCHVRKFTILTNFVENLKLNHHKKINVVLH